MATATELAINSSATALDMANAIFGPGVTVVSASYTGDPLSAGTYSGATSTIPGISPTSTGVILSTGRAADFTNSNGNSNTNTATNTSTDTSGVNGDAQLNAIAGMATYDAAILNASFIPDGDTLTMQFVFSSEEYPEYVSGGVNDSFGVWVNGVFVPVSITVAGNVAIDEVNSGKNENLYINNTGDQYNTEMDGFTYVLSFKAPVNSGQVNTIKIGIADGGDSIYDSNLLIMGDSAQTVTLAMDDDINVVANNQRTFDILGNDNATTGTLTITQINGQNVVAGQTITLTSGQQVRLNADGTITVFSNGVLGAENLSYTITNGTTTDVGYITINTVSAATRDGIVSGTSGNDIIQAGYVGDPDGDLIDSNDGTGVLGTTGNSDLIYAGAGNDSIVSAEGNDIIFGGAGIDSIYGGNGNDTIDGDDGNDLIYGGAGNDALTGGSGVDTLYGGAGNNIIYAGDGVDVVFADPLANNTVYGGTGNDTVTMDSGNDTVLAGDNNDAVYGGAGNDSLLGESGTDLVDAGAGNDFVDGGTGADQLTGGAGNDSVLGGDDNDTLILANGFGIDTLAGGEAGLDNDILNTATMTANTTVTFTGAEAGSITDGTNSAGFSQIEQLVLGSGNDLITGGLGNEVVFAGAGNDTAYGGAGNDNYDMGQGNDSYGTTSAESAGNDTISGGEGSDSIVTGQNNDVIFGGTGADTLSGGMGSDSVYGGDDSDLFTVFDDSEFDLIQGGEGGLDNDTLSFGNTLTTAGVTVTLTGAEQGSYAFNATPAGYAQSTGTFTEIEALSGTGFADTFNGTGSTAGAVINANAGNDTINAGSGNDQIDGGSGNDLIRDGAGNDTVYGGAGVDDILSGAGNDQIFGGSESDLITLLDNSGNDTIAAGEGGDTTGGGDVLNLDINTNATVTFIGNEAGTATFGSNTTSFSEFETVVTDLGNDLINASVTTSGQNIYAGAGQDTVFGGSGNDSILGEAGNDSLVGGAGNDTILGDAGNDTITGGTGRDQLFGGNDVDTFYAGGNATVQGGEGGTDNDTLIVNNVVGLVYGGGTNEAGTLTLADGTTVTFSEIEHLVLNGGTPDGIILGTSGSDSIGAGFVDVNGDVIDNNDALLGNVGSNDDEVYAGAGNDTISGLAGNDFLYGGDNNDSIDGGAGNDYIQGDAGNDTANGGDGNDFIRGDAGNDSVYGGTGNDSVYGGSESDHVYGGDGTDQVYGGTGDDTVYGGIGNDSVTGSEGNDSVFGDDGNDYIQGSSGSDTLFGGLGSDTLLGEEDADLIFGGAGDYVDGYESVTTGTDNDTLNVSGIASITWDKLNPENGTITYASGETLAFYNVEHVIVDGVEVFAPNFIVEGTSGGDLIDGNYQGDLQGDHIDASDNLPGNNDDLVQAGGGNDTVFAGTGNDVVLGEAGQDVLNGEAGNDSLDGGAGNDSLFGGAGDDSLFGGTGNDVLTGGTGNDQLSGGNDRDVIFGGIGDVIDGGSGGDNVDTLDLTSYGQSGTTIIYGGGDDSSGTVNFLDGSGAVIGSLTFTNIENVITCFGSGTMIATDQGEMPVQDLGPGDRVLTRDQGYATIVWAGARKLTAAELIAKPAFQPVRIAKGALGHGLPERDLIVSPQHRMLWSSVQTELLFGETEVLVAALHLVGLPGIRRACPAEGVTYHHVMCAQHEILRSDGAWSESFQPGATTLDGMQDQQRAEILALFPQIDQSPNTYPAARMTLKSREARVLLAN